MFEELRSAIDADRPHALLLALDAWRDSRARELADLVDHIGAAIEADVPPRGQHRQWLDAAMTYDATRVTALLADANVRAYKCDSGWADVIERFGAHDPVLRRLQENSNKPKSMQELPVHQRNRLERLAALVRWPEDPRVARVLANWFARDCFTWAHPHTSSAEEFVHILAEQLERLADVRVVPLLATCIDRPHGRTEALRALQQELAPRVIAAIETRVQPLASDHAAEVRSWIPAAAASSSLVDERELWRAVARDFDAAGPREVLCDYLLERGDTRGDWIVRPDDEALREEHWNDWLGDLALVLCRESRFTNGVLDDALIGMRGTPDWAYSGVGDHRELVTMQRLHASREASPEQYARFAASLVEPLPILELEPAMLPAFASVWPRWPLRHLQLKLIRDRSDWHELVLRIFPELDTLQLDVWGDHERVFVTVPHFAHLRRVILHVSLYAEHESRPLLQELQRRQPNIELRT